MGLSACAEPFFFFPNQVTYIARNELGVPTEDFYFDSEGARLHGWWMASLGVPLATVIHLHGNTGNVSEHAGMITWLPRMNINVLTFDYRGFGLSQGQPTLNGMVMDALAAVAQARERGKGLPFVLLGQSLGGATAIRAAAAAADPSIRLLIIDSAFSSYRAIARMATQKTPLSPFAPLFLGTLPPANQDPLHMMPRVNSPVILLHGEHDRVIPIRHGEQLYAAAPGLKTFLRIPEGHHLDALMRSDVRHSVTESVLRHTRRRSQDAAVSQGANR
jgi:fermentation-respiration switch protein FrsA (DUF1100 family)